ncbi:hypothetical protein BSE24067_01088 [Burkholderia seminalis]|nr:hypothetical protein BSE24067_01088 [Burkholderia seminalis]
MFTSRNSYGRASLWIVASNNLGGWVFLHRVVNIEAVARS